jgi:hypothetical protein
MGQFARQIIHGRADPVRKLSAAAEMFMEPATGRGNGKYHGEIVQHFGLLFKTNYRHASNVAESGAFAVHTFFK